MTFPAGIFGGSGLHPRIGLAVELDGDAIGVTKGDLQGSSAVNRALLAGVQQGGDDGLAMAVRDLYPAGVSGGETEGALPASRHFGAVALLSLLLFLPNRFCCGLAGRRPVGRRSRLQLLMVAA